MSRLPQLIRFGIVRRTLGQFFLALSGIMLLLLLGAAATGDAGVRALGVGALVAAGSGLLLILRSRRPDANGADLTVREAFFLVFCIWLGLPLFGAVPLLFSGHFPTVADAFFEAVSGFTTTGATILPDVEVLPASIQFWRHLMQWLGGMGVVLLALAILPLVGLGGMQLYRAEFSGARSEKLKPRIRETAAALWKIYLGLTAAQTAALWLAGMSAFDAVCHAFSTVATGGFSTRTASIGAFDSTLIEGITVVFMLLGGVSFVQHYRFWVERQSRTVVSDTELRWYFAIVALATAAAAPALVMDGAPLATAIRQGLFQVVSIVTTTGFATADFEAWPPLPQVLLLALMFIGGMAGSTSGGLKTARIVVLAHTVSREFKRMVERRGVFAIRIGGRVIDDDAIHGMLSLIYLSFVVNFSACLLLAALGIDVLTAIGAVTACMFNIGPGLGGVGPAESYAHLPAAAKWVLSACMIVGRLEFYAVLVVFTRSFWKR